MVKSRTTSWNGFTSSRREFNAQVLGVGLGIVAASPIVLSAKGAIGESPKHGGQLVVGFSAQSTREALDPALASDQAEIGRSLLMHNRLIEIQPDMTQTPGLAIEWETNDTADEWTFRLRKDVVFHNGKTMTPDDVIYSYRRVMDKNLASPGYAYVFNIGDITSEGDDIVRFKLKTPDADFATMVFHYHLVIIPDGYTDFTKPIGTGPFMMKSFQPGINMVLERNPNYWKTDRPYIDEIFTVSIPDPTARINALLTGEIHAMNSVDPKQLSRLTQSSDVQLLQTSAGKHSPFVMRVDTPPYDNNDVRLALKYAIDRQKFLDLAFSGLGSLGNDHPVPPFDPYYCNELPMRQYDPDKVKFHLKKAGAESTTFTLHASDAAMGGVDAAVVYAEMARQAGIDIKIVRAPVDDYWDSTWMQVPFFMSDWMPRPTAGLIMSYVYTSTAPWNESYWKRPRFDEILILARSTTDTTKRKELYCEAQRMIHEDGGEVIPCFNDFIDGVASSVKNMRPHPLGRIGWFMWDDVWLDV